jgi:hypothetical protein
MNSNSNSGPLIKAAGLWQKTSVKGGQYLTGRMGGLKVLVMENRDRKTDDDPSHTLFVAEAPDRRQGVQQAGQERSGGVGAPPTGQRQPQPHRSDGQGYGQWVADHQAPLNADLDDAPEWAR